MALEEGAREEYLGAKQDFEALTARAKATANPAEKQNLLNLAEQARGRAKQIYDTGQRFSAADTARFAAQGATLGFGDEIEARIRAPFSEQTYPEIRDELREGMAATRAAYPGQALSAELGGSFAAPGMGALYTLSKATTLPRMLAKTTAVGTGMGALAGGGYSEEEGALEAAFDVGKGALLGGGTALALGVGAPLMLTVGNRLFKALSRTDPERANLLIGRAMRESGLDEAAVMARLDDLGPEATLADVDNALLDLAGVARQKGDEATALTDYYALRNRGAGARLLSDIEEVAEMPSGGFLQSQQRVRKAQQEANRRLYGALSDEMVPWPYVNDIVMTDRGRKAYNTALRNWQDRNRTNATFEDAIPLEILDDMKRILGREGTRVQRGQKSGTEDIYFELSGDLVSRLDDVTENYRTARQSHQYASEILDAGQAGREAYKRRGDDFNLMVQEFEGMSPVQKRQFQKGLLETTAEEIGKGGGVKGTGFAGSRLGTPEVRERRLGLLEPEYKPGAIEDAIAREERFSTVGARLNPNVGSRTQIERAAAERADELVGIRGALTETMPSDANIIGRAIENAAGVSRSTANEMARKLMSPNVTAEEVRLMLQRGDIPPSLFETLQKYLPQLAALTTGATTQGARLISQENE